jgi:hypothetical protein
VFASDADNERAVLKLFEKGYSVLQVHKATGLPLVYVKHVREKLKPQKRSRT